MRIKPGLITILISAALLASSCDVLAPEPPPTPTPPPTSTPTQTSTATQPPTLTPTVTETLIPSDTPTPISPLREEGCIRWDEVTEEHVGQTICVFGVIVSSEDRSHGENTWGEDFYVYFSEDTSSTNTDFRLFAPNAYGWGFDPGLCLSVTGMVRSYGEGSFLFINPISGSNPGEHALYEDMPCE